MDIDDGAIVGLSLKSKRFAGWELKWCKPCSARYKDCV